MASDQQTAQELIDQARCLEHCLPSGLMPAIQLQALLNLANNPINIGSVTLSVSDIEIGAVELKDSTTNNRAIVTAAGEVKVIGTFSMPAGAATEAKQDAGNASLASIDGKLANPMPVTGTITGITNPVAVTGTFWQATQPISATSLPLPDGASTEATLALIKAKTDNIPPLGQALAAASVPVVLTAAQLTTLTPPAAITGFATEATLLTRTKPADQQHTILDSGTLTSITNNVTVVGTGTFVVQATLAAETTKVIGTVNQGTSPWVVSGTVTTGGLTDTQLRATPVPVSGTVALGAGAAVIGHVIVDSGIVTTVSTVTAVTSITNVVHVDDNAGSLTVDAPVGTPVFVRLSDGAAAITTLPVSLASVPSHAVTNAGTFAVQATLTAETTKVIGTVNQGTSPWVVSGSVTSTNTAPTTIFNGVTTVATAGTRVVLAASTTVKSVTIKALVTNTGTIYVGNSGVTSANGYPLRVGGSISMDIANLNTVNLDASVSGEGVSYIAVN